jgi:hypothetical protein
MRFVQSAIRNPQSAILGVVVLLLTAASARADDRDKALEVIEAAIKAQGGSDALGKVATQQRSVKGTQFLFGKEHPFTSDASIQLPSRYRDSILQIIGDQKNAVTIAIDGTRGWQSTGGMSTDLPRERVDEIAEELYVEWAMTLVPLKDKKFDLAMLPEGKFAGKPTTVVKVTSKDRPELKLAFDKASGLLVKVERRASLAGQKYDKEYWLMDYKDFSGVKLPGRVLVQLNNTKSVEWKIENYRFPDKLEATLFTKP